MSIKVDQIVRSDRKTLEVQISIEGHIIVRAPMDESMESIENYLDEKKNSTYLEHSRLQEQNI